MKNNFLKYGFLGIALLCSGAMIANTASNSFAAVRAAEDPTTDGPFYKVSNGAEGFKLLLSADLGDYASLRVQDLKDFKDAIVDNIADEVINSLDTLGEPDPMLTALEDIEWTPIRTVYSSYDPTNVDAMIEGILMTNGVPDIEKVDAMTADVNGAYGAYVKYIFEGVASKAGDREAALSELEFDMSNVAYDISKTAYVNAGLSIGDAPYPFDGVASGVTSLHYGPYVPTLQEMTIIASMLESAIENARPANPITVDGFVAACGLSKVENDVKTLLADGTAGDIQAFFTNISPTTIAELVDAINFDKDDMLDVLDTIGATKLLDIAKKIDVDGIREILSAVDGFTAGDLKAFLEGNYRDISITSLINSIKSISLDGNIVFENKQLKKDGIVALLRDFPRPSELATRSDADMRLSWDVVVSTVLGDVSSRITLGFYGDCTLVRTICDFIAKTLDITYVDGTLKIKVNTPNALAGLLRRLSASAVMPDDLKVRMFKFFNSTVEEMYNTVSTKLLADFIADMQSIDYESVLATIFSADELNNIFGTTFFTDEKLDQIVDGFMKLLRLRDKVSFDAIMDLVGKFVDLSDATKDQLESYYNSIMNLLDKIAGKEIDSEMLRKFIDPNDDTYTNENIYNVIGKLSDHSGMYDKIQNLITKLYNKLPMGAHDKSIMNTYKGNGLFAWAGTINFDLNEILTSILGAQGATVYEGLESILGTLPTSISLDLSVQANDIYSVEYVFDDENSFKGALPSGVDVAMYAGETTWNGAEIVRWVDALGNEVTSMPAADTVLYAVLDFDLDTTDGVNKAFDGFATEIGVIVDNPLDYSYSWTKDGAPLLGAMSDKLSVCKTSDSGEYQVRVTRISDGYTKYSDVITVTITVGFINLDAIEWDYDAPFEYDGESHRVQIDEATLPENVGVLYGGIIESKDAGTFEAACVFYPLCDDITLTGQVFRTLIWEVKPQEITLTDAPEWDYVEAFDFDGEYHTVNVVETSLPEHVIVKTVTGNIAKNAGAYQAVATLATDSKNYVIAGETEYTLDWSIGSVAVDVSDAAWQDTTSYVYDGELKSVKLNELAAADYVNVTYANNSSFNAGQFTATATIALKDAVNNTWVDGTTDPVTLTLDWEVTQAVIVVPTSVEWNYTAPFTYDGNMHQVYIVTELPEHISVFYDGQCIASNAANYSVTAVLSAENDNYVLSGTTEFTCNWAINPAVINLNGLAWNYYGAYTYTGEEFTVDIDTSTLPAGTDVYAYGGDYYATDAGNYQALALIVATDSNHVVAGTGVVGLNWTINQAQLDLSGITWDYDGAYTFNDKVRSPMLKDVPNGLEVVYGGDRDKLNVGTYSSTATIVIDNPNNYVITGNTELSLNWEIKAKEIDVSYVAWDYKNPFKYDGNEHTVGVLNGTLPEHVSVSYTGTQKATNAGSYQVQAVLATDSANYVIKGSNTLTLNWEIAKAQIDLAGAQWDYLVAIDFDGAEHTVSIKESSISDKVTVSYTGTRTATEVGKYNATATFALKSEYAANYTLVNATPRTLDWEIKKAVIPQMEYESVEKDGENSIAIVKTNEKLPVGITLHVDEIDAADLKGVKWNGLFGSGRGVTVYGYYDVYFLDEAGNRVEVSGEYEALVKLLLSDVASERAANYKVVRVAEDKSLTKVNSYKEGDYMAFETNLLGNFAIVEVGTTAVPWWVLALLIVAGAVIAVESFVIIVKGKKKKD